VRCEKVIFGTNAYERGLIEPLRRSLLPVASFIVATAPLSGNLRATILPEGHVTSDTRKLLSYSRLDREGRLLVGGRGRFADPHVPADFGHVELLLKRLFPQVGEPEIDFRWSGRVAITTDFLPHVHEPSPGLIAAAGYNGRGVAMATVLGAAAGRYAVTGNREELPLPLSPIRPIPFHGWRRLYLAAGALWYRMQDRWSSRSH
jgi:glycine/D-amino acid oxidase-like deaminating enzyme